MATGSDTHPCLEVEGLQIPGQGNFRLDVPRLTLEPGTTTLVLGRNGSGKSTLLDAILGVILPKSGRIRMFGECMAKISPDSPLRHRIGAQIQGITWTWSIKVREIISIHASIYRVSNPEVLERLGIPKLANLLYRKLSTGQRRRVDLAVALAHDPSFIVLDEPGAGLDNQYEAGLREILEARGAAGATILMASHDGSDLALADRLLWLDQGKIVEDDLPGALVSRIIGDQVCIVDAAEADARAEIAALIEPLAKSCNVEGGRLFAAGDHAMRTAFLRAVEARPDLGYSVRPATAADLLRALNATPREEQSA